MIHAFALEPKLVATWGRREAFRFIYDKFGLGTPRVMLEFPSLSTWKRQVFAEVENQRLSPLDKKRVEELLGLLTARRSRRAQILYESVRTWLENAEVEYQRVPFAAILATENPRGHPAVLIDDAIDASDRWTCPTGATPERTPQALAHALESLLMNSRVVHLVDPHFSPQNARHRKVLEALVAVLAVGDQSIERVCVHCDDAAGLATFEREAAAMAERLPNGIVIEFSRWRERSQGEKLHNRYVLTDIGGVALGIGLDASTSGPGQTDDLILLPRATYLMRWAQYAENNGAFELVDRPAMVRGTYVRRGALG